MNLNTISMDELYDTVYNSNSYLGIGTRGNGIMERAAGYFVGTDCKDRYL